jgi:translocation and assembly module TamA
MAGGRRGIVTCLMLGIAGLAALPAPAFELFGIHLWGEREPEEAIEVIDPLPYAVTWRISGGDAGLRRQLETASSLWTDRETPASGNAGLLSKARGDYRRLLAALYAAGYYGPAISIRAAGQEAADASLDASFAAPVPVVIDVQVGPQFRFGRAEIVNAPPEVVFERESIETPAHAGFAVGETARSGIINQASALTIEAWRHLSRAKARETDREVIADHATDLLDVTLAIEPGRAARYGPTYVTGSNRVDPAFIAFMADLPEGAPFDPDDLDEGLERLNRLGVFRSLRFEEAEEIGPDGSLPITVRVEDRRPRSIGAGATYSTIDGIGVSAFWEHRNLFRRAERLRFSASVDGIGSIDVDEFSYEFAVNFTKPGVWTPDTNFVAGASAFRLDYETYRQQGIAGSVGITQQFSRRLTGSALVQVSRSRYEDDFGTRDFTIFALLGSAAYDRRNVPLDATRGYYLAASFQPFYEAEFGNVAARGTVEGRGYLSVGSEDHITLAQRVLVGSYAGAPPEESPPDLLFFAGGGGSVRGYAYQSIGVESFPFEGEEIVIGGQSMVVTNSELRWRFTDRWGGVGFVDTGLVAEESTFSGESDFRVGGGAGVRFYTGIGVLRADVATPLTPRDEDGYVALYIGIGQAF